MNAVIYLGIVVNILGAIFLMYYALRYTQDFKESEKLTVKKEELRARWLRKRMLGFGIMIGGIIIAVIGCLL